MGYANDSDQVDEFVRERRQEMVESWHEIAAAMKAYTGPLMLIPGGILPTMSPVIDCGDTLITANNLSVNKIYNGINNDKLHNIFDLDDLNNDKFSAKDFATVLRIMDLGYRYADADKYYTADSEDKQCELVTPADGVVIKAQSMGVYTDGEINIAVIRTENDDFYVRQVTSDDYDNMRECTYDEFNPWHKDVSQSLQDNGEDYTNIENIKTLSVERQDDGGKAGKIGVEAVDVGDNDAYDMESSALREKYEQRIKAQLDAIDATQAVRDSVEAKAEQDEMNRILYGRKAAKYM